MEAGVSQRLTTYQTVSESGLLIAWFDSLKRSPSSNKSISTLFIMIGTLS